MAPTPFQRRVIEQATGGSFEQAVANMQGQNLQPEGTFNSGTNRPSGSSTQSTAGSTATPFQAQVIEQTTGQPFQGTISDGTTPSTGQEEGVVRQVYDAIKGTFRDEITGERTTLGNWLFGNEFIDPITGERKPVFVTGTLPLSPAGGISPETLAKLTPIKENLKTITLIGNFFKTVFSRKALAFYSGWAGSIFLGKWAQAESAEPITIPLRDAYKQAKETGDWSIYDEYKAAADEITDLSVWERILSWSPISAIPGILNKIRGVKKGIALIDAIAEKEKQTAVGFELGGFGSAFEQNVAEAAERRRDLKLQQRDEDRAESEKYWNDIYEKNKKRKADDRIANEEYWAEIKKQNSEQPWNDADQKVLDAWNAGKSTLSFAWLGKGFEKKLKPKEE